MDDPTRPWLLEIEDPVAFVRDVRNWQAEQRAKYGPDWEDTDASEYNRSRGLPPPFDPNTEK
jgi:hypothetical protein